jgi:hypothetical protein
MFTFYDYDWYTQRNYTVPDQPLPSPEEQREFLISGPFHRICMSDTIVRMSSLPPIQLTRNRRRDGQPMLIPIGRGLFANRAFQKGERITVAPVAVLDKKWVDLVSRASPSLIQNYCLWDGKAAIVLLPMSTMVMMNHAPSHVTEEGGEGVKANTEMRWFSWRRSETAEDARHRVFSMKNVPALVQSPMVPLDIEIYATRDIEQGEELLMDYGEAWEQRWNRALMRCAKDLTFHRLEDGEYVCSSIGKFRSYLYVPQGMFPKEWAIT